MKIGLFSLKSKSDNYFLPIFEHAGDIEDNLTLMKRCIANIEISQLKNYKDKQFYLLGIRDDITGVIESKIELICDLDELVNIRLGREAQKELLKQKEEKEKNEAAKS